MHILASHSVSISAWNYSVLPTTTGIIWQLASELFYSFTSVQNKDVRYVSDFHFCFLWLLQYIAKANAFVIQIAAVLLFC